MTVFDKVVKVVGSQSKLAEKLHLSRQAVHQWRVQIPASRVKQIERLTGIPRAELRPDIYEE